MSQFTVGRLPRGVVLGLVLLCSTWCVAEMHPDVPQSTNRATTAACSTGSANTQQTCVHPFQFVGVYSADGEFRPASKHETWHDLQSVTLIPRKGMRDAEVPPFVKLRPLERQVENYAPPKHATVSARGQTRFGSMRDSILSVIYGRERAIIVPHDLVVDSKGRVIISDPGARAIHVLDGKNSFRVMAGPNRRMTRPGSLAVDADDNIYVSDPDRGLVVVYDRFGNFQRYIGMVDDETLFVYPTGIAVDSVNQRLYVLDSPRGVLFMMDLYGHLVGRFAHGDPLFLSYPTQVKVIGERLYILDQAGTRVQITDLVGNPLRQFNTFMKPSELHAQEMDISVDSEGQVYVSNFPGNSIHVFSPEGKFVSSFGPAGNGDGEFMFSDGIWIDSANRLYVADKLNRRVQVFELTKHADLPTLATLGK